MPSYIVQNTTMVNIADAIREKTGSTAAIYPGNMPARIRSIQTASGSDSSDVPADIAAEAERVASGMLSKMGSNALTFVAISDMHEMGDGDHADSTILERYRRANRNAGQAARLIGEKVPLDFFTNLGDVAWGAQSTTIQGGVQSIRRAMEYTAEVSLRRESFVVPGNHDPLTYSYSVNGEYLEPDMMEGLMGTYRYQDFTAKKVRVICLNTADNEGAAVTADGGTERMSGGQLQWFCEALDLSGKGDAPSWSIIILSHHPVDWGNIKPAAAVLAAYQKGIAYSVTHNGTAVSYNFSGKNGAGIIGNFHGHTHCFKVADISGTTIKRIAIPNACYARTNEYGEGGNTEFGEMVSYEKTDDSTGRNTAFCLVSVDLAEKIIYADCFGAGYDRIISYGTAEVVSYSITNSLTNATTSNGATTVTEGSGYTAVITVDSGYELESITVTMGGMDITATAVSGSNITIPSVTGNIVIRAAAVKIDDGYQPEDNLVPTATSDGTTIFNNGLGYENGKYLSSGSVNAFSSDTACVATGSIYLPSGVEAIYVKGATWDAANSHVRFFCGQEVGGISYTLYADESSNASHSLSYFFTLEILGTNYYKFTLTNNAKTYWYGKYYRLSLVGTGENLIITHDQPIE